MTSLMALTDFKIVLPVLMMNQDDVLEHTAQAHSKVLAQEGKGHEEITTLMKRYGVKSKQIAQRGFENIHIAAEGKDILERTRFFGSRGREVLSQFYPAQSAPPDHLVHVTCTGYISHEFAYIHR